MSATESAPNGGAVTFVNRFTLHGSPEEFERAFSQTAEFLGRQPGLLQYTLLRHAERPDSYVNIALWRDAASLRSAVAQPEFAAHAAALRAVCTSEPNLYLPRWTYRAEPTGSSTTTGSSRSVSR